MGGAPDIAVDWLPQLSQQEQLASFTRFFQRAPADVVLRFLVLYAKFPLSTSSNFSVRPI